MGAVVGVGLGSVTLAALLAVSAAKVALVTALATLVAV